MENYCYMHYAQLIQDNDNPRWQLKTCSVEGCNNPHCAKGYCRPHYYYQSRHGDLGLSYLTAVTEQDSKVSSETDA